MSDAVTRQAMARWGDDAFAKFRQRPLTSAVRVVGAFSCVTADGETVTCEDGYLAIDAEGYPFPIPRAVFERDYEAQR